LAGTALRSHGAAGPTPPSSNGKVSRPSAAGKIEKGQVGPGVGFAVGVEQMAGADVVLIDGILHQPHPEPSNGEFRPAALHNPQGCFPEKSRSGSWAFSGIM